MSVLPDPGATRAVLIGTSHYDHLESLPAVSNNLTALAEALTGPTSWTLPQEHCTILSNPTTAEMTMAAVRAAAEQARDTVLIYFAGHGLVERRPGQHPLAVVLRAWGDRNICKGN